MRNHESVLERNPLELYERAFSILRKKLIKPRKKKKNRLHFVGAGPAALVAGGRGVNGCACSYFLG